MRTRWIALICVTWCVSSSARAQQWPVYSGDKAGTKYSALDLINKDNVGKLKVAWRWSSPDNDVRRANPFKVFDLIPFIHEPTPLFVNGVLYTSTSMSQAADVDPTTGKTKWVHDPGTWKWGRPTN